MELKNNIKKILEKKDVSIRQLSKAINMDYANTHNLVNREKLDDTKGKTLAMLAEYLEINVEDLWSK